MKLYLASFLEPHNFGPGRLISVADGDKPDHLEKECELVFPPFIPSQKTSNQYRIDSLTNPKEAGANFEKSFGSELDAFVAEVKEDAQKESSTPQELLPFEEGDTLASWQREHFTHYRGQIAKALQQLGYEVVEH